MPAFWLSVTAVITPSNSGPTKEVTLPVNANSPKYCATRSFGAMWIRSVREGRLQRAAGRADQESQHQIGTLRRTGKQRAAGHRRGDPDEQVSKSLSTSRMAMTDSSRISKLPDITRFGPSLSSKLAAEPRAEGAGDRQQNTEAADLEGVPAEGAAA